MSRPRNIPARSFVALAIMVALLNSTAASPLYGVYRAHWSLDTFTISAIFAVYAGGTLLSLLLLGRLSDRLRDRRIAIAGALLIVIAGALVFGTATDLHALFVGRFLAGFGTGAVTGAANAALIELDPRLDARRSAVLATSVFTIGCAVGPAISSLCLALDLDPLRLPFLVIAALALVALAGLAIVPWRPVRFTAPTGPIDVTSPAASTPRLAAFSIAAAAVFIAWAVGSSFASLGPSFVHELLHMPSMAAAGLIVTIFQLVGGLSQIAAGRLSSDRALIAGTVIVAAATLACLIAIEAASAVGFVAGTVLIGIGYGAAFVGAAGVVNRIAPPDRRAAFVSAFYVIAYLANCLPVLLLGWLGDLFGLAGAFLALTIFAALATVIVVPAAIVVLKPARQIRRPVT
ncbi:Predicted arabinose efflux permease, MFS family [Kaistia soli DSM 19436]|uniref:Predicted arabinose efflux permease, MFS family n=1 Tax=Kaistia soli DSM 19436 TaxID=1122133 RepID=A0A1M4W7P9_9HYPH|nr:MFS transporter [Kaistia soli]SHE77123.1 Predicted arabinose efflux permease, MFS family [Kaistia soli DSM 19436]